MPVYEFLDGIKISLFSNDHVPPHIHASIGEHEALIDIKQVTVIIGTLPKTQLRKVLKYVAQNQNDLLEAFYSLNPKIKRI